MTLLLAVPMETGSGSLIVEVDRSEIPGGLVLATPKPGEVAARAVHSLSDSLGQLEPLLRTMKRQLVSIAPDEFTVEFGIKLGGETGIILAKGTAEVNFVITMVWKGPKGD